MVEITFPKTVKFDFLLVIFGLTLLSSIVYIGLNKLPLILNLFLVAVSFLLFLIGLDYMRDDFLLDFQIKQLTYFKERYQVISTLRDFNLLSSKKYDVLVSSLKNDIEHKA